MAELNNNIQRDMSAASGAHGGAHTAHIDEWHHHTKAEGVPQGEHTAQINTLNLVKWLIGIIVAVVVIVMALMKLTEMKATQLRAQVVETDWSSEYISKRATVEAELSANGTQRVYAPISGTAVRIPLDDAMNKVVGNYQGGKKNLSESLPVKHSPLK